MVLKQTKTKQMVSLYNNNKVRLLVAFGKTYSYNQSNNSGQSQQREDIQNVWPPFTNQTCKIKIKQKNEKKVQRKFDNT